jgi:valyl-tRNA synthetase
MDTPDIVFADEEVVGPSTYEEIPAHLRGLDRLDARNRIVADLEAQGLIARVEDHVHMVPFGDRGGVPIEPYLTEQWYVDAATLAKPAIAAVEQGRTRFVPANWAKTYFEWMRNIQPWCISRQLWWGHQIPAWYGPDGEVFVAMSEAEAQAAARAHYGKDVLLERDPDVLDTWFSSALWPFSTLGWPEETPELKHYYPTDVLVTGFDIIFFWVARMMMMGLRFMGEEPFHTVYIHALVRDAHGQKMAKSKGNVIDPLQLIDACGADALRFTLIAMAAQGRDVNLSESRVEGYRNFATKLWNAARFCQMNGCTPDPALDPASCRLTVNRWIVGGVAELAETVTRELEAYRFNEAAGALYRFTWGSFCDWYVELIKPILGGDDAAAKAETRAVAAWALDQILHLLHPFMPFITEELWDELMPGGVAARGTLLITAPWPRLSKDLVDREAADEMDWVVRLISQIRALRAEMNVPPAARIQMRLKGATSATARRLDLHRERVLRLARLGSATVGEAEPPAGAVQLVLDEAIVVLPLGDVIDVDQERARLEKELQKVAAEMAQVDRKLSNRQFLAKAPEAVVEAQRERRDEYVAAETKLRQALDRLAAA